MKKLLVHINEPHKSFTTKGFQWQYQILLFTSTVFAYYFNNNFNADPQTI